MRLRRVLVGAVVATVATVGLGSVAGAIPEHKTGGLWDCGSGETLIVEAGRNGWIDGVHYHAVTIRFEGTFTPVEGEPQSEVFEKTYGNGRGLDSPDAITCTQHVEESDEEGTFVGDGFVVAVPVGR